MTKCIVCGKDVADPIAHMFECAQIKTEVAESQKPKAPAPMPNVIPSDLDSARPPEQEACTGCGGIWSHKPECKLAPGYRNSQDSEKKFPAPITSTSELGVSSKYITSDRFTIAATMIEHLYQYLLQNAATAQKVITKASARAFVFDCKSRLGRYGSRTMFTYPQYRWMAILYRAVFTGFGNLGISNPNLEQELVHWSTE